MRYLKDLEIEKIMYFEADSNYTIIHFQEQKRMVSSLTLGKHQKYFPNFIRVSRKYLLNPEFINELQPKNLMVKFENRWLRVSRRRMNYVKMSNRNHTITK